MGLLDSLEMGKKSLAASQLAMDVTGQNIANANTDGYSRKRINVSADQRMDDTFGQMGNGVDIKNVQRLRNEFLDEQISDQISWRGYHKEIDNALERVENVFNEPTDNSLNAMLDGFWDSWHDLSNNPADLSARQSVVTSAQVMTSQFQSVGGELRDYKVTINNAIETEVSNINNLARDIKRLNDEIATAEMGVKGTANDSRDRRQVALRELAEKVPIDYVEDSLGRVTVTTQGIVIVGPQETIDLELYRETKTEADGQEVPLNFTRFAASALPFRPTHGSFAALFDIRDNQIQKYQDQLNDITKAIVTEVNKFHETGYDLDGDTGIHFFDPEKTTATNITLSADILKDSKNIAAASGGKLSKPTVDPLAETVPANGVINFTDPATNPDHDVRYRPLVNGSVVLLDNTGRALREGVGQDYTVDYKLGKVYINTTNVAVGSNLQASFQYNDSPFGGTGDGSKALNIAKIKDQAALLADSQGNPTQTVQEFYSSFIGTLGIDRNEARSNFETRDFIVQQMDQRQQEVSGVSLDEEMANMIKFEHTYQAGARYITTINSLMDAVLGLVG